MRDYYFNGSPEDVSLNSGIVRKTFKVFEVIPEMSSLVSSLLAMKLKSITAPKSLLIIYATVERFCLVADDLVGYNGE